MRGHESILFVAVERIALIQRAAVDDEGKVDSALDRQGDSGGGELHSGKRFDALQHLTDHVLALGRGIVLAAGQRGLHGENVVRVEAGLRGTQSEEGADHKRRASEQDDGQRHFADDQQAADAILTETGAGASAGFLQGGVYVHAGNLYGGKQAEQDSS